MLGFARTSLLGCLLIVSAPLDAETREDATAEPAPPRYSLTDSGLDRASVKETTDARFQLDARLLAAPVAHPPEAGFELRAKLVTAAAAAATCSPNYVFANGFE